MDYQSVIASLPRGLKAADAEDYVGGETMLKDLGVQPLSRRNRAVVYDRYELDAAMDQMRLQRDGADLSPKPLKPGRGRPRKVKP